jgi:DNA-binding XRE family transcriptional regulator
MREPRHIKTCLVRHRQKKGWSRPALATAAGLSPHTVAFLENGGGNLSSLAAALTALGCQLTPEPAKLAQLRRESGVALATIAGRVRVSRQTLTVLERGGKGRVATLVAFAKGLGIKPTITPVRRPQPTWHTPPISWRRSIPCLAHSILIRHHRTHRLSGVGTSTLRPMMGSRSPGMELCTATRLTMRCRPGLRRSLRSSKRGTSERWSP